MLPHEEENEKEKDPPTQIKLFRETITTPSAAADNTVAAAKNTVAAAENTVGDDEAKKKRKEAMKGVEEAGDNMKQKKKREDGCSSGERNLVFGIAPPVFHPDILGHIVSYQSKIQPDFLFWKTLDNADVGNRIKAVTIPAVLCGRLLTGLSIAAGVQEDSYYLQVIARDAKERSYVIWLNKPTADHYSVGGESWVKVVRDNGLKAGDTVEGWGIRYRHHIEMVFLIFKN